MAKGKNKKKGGNPKQNKEEMKVVHEKNEQPPSDDDSSVSSEEEGEDLILEGVLVRNPDVDSSSDEDDDSSSDSDSDGERVEPMKKKAKTSAGSTKSKAQKKKKDKKKGPEIIPVDFTFNDMNEKYFHAVKNHLLSQPVYAPYSSALSDIMIENIAVGTVVSTEDGEDNVFGFASVLNVTTYNEKDCIKKLKGLFLCGCPKEHKVEMETVLSGKTKRPAGMLIHGRMVNLPLEITLVLHEQLILDMDWAVDNAGGGKIEQKSLDFGAFMILAPCTRDNTTHAIMYKNFDDEIFAGCAEFVYTISSSNLKKAGGPNSGSGDGESNNNDDELVAVIVCAKTGHRQGMKELKEMIHGA
eukprot:CAMPEP_0194075102 /NCGR_PEP_ID=MMETSP0149-20130528/2130_1 /TAXON_ID=122233 /ORGANISM="Chaetoceros debilis, Strain MM31A-1" /LENGTH=354 /DNA_ID=CAMNT_0038755459 /DNA_START=87 /DNA_END=1151 /DNA_ORIENTATION=+